MANFGTFSDSGESDNVAIVDGSDPLKKASVSLNGDAGVADGLSGGGVFGALSLVTGGTAYEAKVGVSRLANRKSLVITALDDMFWGYANTVTIANGMPLYKNQQIVFSIDPNDANFQVWVVAAAGGKSARISESP